MPRGTPKSGLNPGWFRKGHAQPRTEQHRRRLAEAQRKAWATKRQRLPIGSKYIDHDGYVRVKVVEGAGYWVPEHILVVENLIGRELSPGEIVHHIDMQPTSNEPDNLHIFPSKSAHNEAHRSLNDLVAGLIQDGIVVFDRLAGRYNRQ